MFDKELERASLEYPLQSRLIDFLLSCLGMLVSKCTNKWSPKIGLSDWMLLIEARSVMKKFHNTMSYAAQFHKDWTPNTKKNYAFFNGQFHKAVVPNFFNKVPKMMVS